MLEIAIVIIALALLPLALAVGFALVVYVVLPLALLAGAVIAVAWLFENANSAAEAWASLGIVVALGAICMLVIFNAGRYPPPPKK